MEILVVATITLILVTLGFCKVAAKGNIYCPNCESESHKAENCGETIIRTCNACGEKWS